MTVLTIRGLQIVQSTGDNRLLLFDPKTGPASVEAKILELPRGYAGRGG